MNIDKICNKIAKDLNEDPELVKQVVMYQFQYIVDTMKDDTNTMDILINRLFKFKLKSRFKDNKLTKYTPYQ